jgi:phage baseplate assembly protein W
MSVYVRNSGFTGSEVATRSSTEDKLYSDLNFFFKPSPFYVSQGLSGDVLRVFDSDSIRQSVRTIVLTNKFEKPFNTNFGVGVRNFLFDPFESNLPGVGMFQLEEEIKEQLDKIEDRLFETRFIVDEVSVLDTRDENTLNVRILYRLKSVTSSAVETVDIKIVTERVG